MKITPSPRCPARTRTSPGIRPGAAGRNRLRCRGRPGREKREAKAPWRQNQLVSSPPARAPAPCDSPSPPPRLPPRRSAPRLPSRELLHADRPVLAQRSVGRKRDPQGVPCLAGRAGTFRAFLHRVEETLQLSAIGGPEPIEKI